MGASQFTLPFHQNGLVHSRIRLKKSETVAPKGSLDVCGLRSFETDASLCHSHLTCGLVWQYLAQVIWKYNLLHHL